MVKSAVTGILSKLEGRCGLADHGNGCGGGVENTQEFIHLVGVEMNRTETVSCKRGPEKPVSAEKKATEPTVSGEEPDPPQPLNMSMAWTR